MVRTVGWEHNVLLIKYVMSTSMSPFPKSVRDAMKRQQYERDMQRNTLMEVVVDVALKLSSLS